jgi:hypothetical protein
VSWGGQATRLAVIACPRRRPQGEGDSEGLEVVGWASEDALAVRDLVILSRSIFFQSPMLAVWGVFTLVTPMLLQVPGFFSTF